MTKQRRRIFGHLLVGDRAVNVCGMAMALSLDQRMNVDRELHQRAAVDDERLPGVAGEDDRPMGAPDEGSSLGDHACDETGGVIKAELCRANEPYRLAWQPPV